MKHTQISLLLFRYISMVSLRSVLTTAQASPQTDGSETMMFSPLLDDCRLLMVLDRANLILVAVTDTAAVGRRRRVEKGVVLVRVNAVRGRRDALR